MTSTQPTLGASTSNPAKAKVDVVVVGVLPGQGLSQGQGQGQGQGREEDPELAAGAEAIDAAFDGRLARTLGSLGAKGRADEVTLAPSPDALAAPLVAAVGLGRRDPCAEDLRRAAGAACARLADIGSSILFALAPEGTGGDGTTAVGPLAEGALLGCYRFSRYRSGDKQSRIADITIAGVKPRDKATKSALARARAVAEAVARCRDWINLPPSDLSPAEFATQARTQAKGLDVDVEILDERALAKGGYGGILGVGQGSTNPPRLVKVAYRHPKATADLALVGKGITFDSGGLSLKPNAGMTTMKCDMSGAAAVLAAVLAVARLELPVNVTAWAPMAENMPSGSAQRPSDVLTMYGGTTVEVLNTDAEGRLVLADALVRSGEDEPDLVVDVATLTGACVVALGDRVFGIMAGDDRTRDLVHSTAEEAGELGWPLPIPEGTRERLNSPVADIANVSGERHGGALAAAAFLREFVADGRPWAHLDIAGPAFNEGAAWGYTPKGGTGSAVRTLIGLAERGASGRL